MHSSIKGHGLFPLGTVNSDALNMSENLVSVLLGIFSEMKLVDNVSYAIFL
jgi:hypothetical protein